MHTKDEPIERSYIVSIAQKAFFGNMIACQLQKFINSKIVIYELTPGILLVIHLCIIL